MALSVPLAAGARDRPGEASTGKSAKTPEPVEVRFTDNSTMKLTLRDEHVEIITRYGRLQVPVADVRRIEFATRISDDVSRRVQMAIADLGSPHFKQREAATAELRALREKAYAGLVQAAKSGDQETARRIEELLDWLRSSVAQEHLETRQHDVIHTEDMKIAGRIVNPVMKVHTYQFGEQPLKLADVRGLRLLSVVEPEPEPKNVAPDPGNLTSYQNQMGKSFTFRVTGAPNGSVWGTDVYTADSSLAVAAVHAGVLQPGQTGLVKVTMVPAPIAYAGSTRHGITSAAYGNYPSAFRVSK